MLEMHPPDLQDFILRKIASGEVESVDDFAVKAASLFRELDCRFHDLKRSIDDSISEIEDSNYSGVNGEEELRQLLENIKRQGKEHLAYQIAEFRADPLIDIRIRQLATLANEGQLTQAEEREYASYIGMATAIAIIKARQPDRDEV